MIAFIIKSTVFLLVIYLLYMTFITKENAPVFKRYFLLLGIVFSLLVSIVEFNVNIKPSDIIIPVAINRQLTEINTTGTVKLADNHTGYRFATQSIFIVYLFVCSVLMVRYVRNIKRLMYPRKYAVQLNGYKIAVVKGNPSPYSFLDTIYLSEKDYNNGAVFREIIIHELLHINQKHSIDILFIEFLQVLFWFNPILFLFKKEIKLNHEYLADKEVINSDIDIRDYQHFMLNNTFRNNSSYLGSSFNYSFIKKRIIMLQKEKSSKRLFLKGIIVFPLIALLTVVFTFNSNAMPFNNDNWWEPILKKHNLELASYNNFGDVFEMGEKNSIADGVATLTNATMIIKGENNGYLIIQADRIVHNIETGVLTIHSGKSIEYRETDAEVTTPYKSFVNDGSIKLNLNDIRKKSNLQNK